MHDCPLAGKTTKRPVFGSWNRGEGAVAEPLMMRSDDWTKFRNLDTLSQKAGVPKDKILPQAVRELVDNALDTGGACCVGRTDDGGFFVSDNGPGIPGTDEQI